MAERVTDFGAAVWLDRSQQRSAGRQGSFERFSNSPADDHYSTGCRRQCMRSMELLFGVDGRHKKARLAAAVRRVRHARGHRQ